MAEQDDYDEAFRQIRNANFKYEDYKRYYTLIYEASDYARSGEGEDTT